MFCTQERNHGFKAFSVRRWTASGGEDSVAGAIQAFAGQAGGSRILPGDGRRRERGKSTTRFLKNSHQDFSVLFAKEVIKFSLFFVCPNFTLGIFNDLFIEKTEFVKLMDFL